MRYNAETSLWQDLDTVAIPGAPPHPQIDAPIAISKLKENITRKPYTNLLNQVESLLEFIDVIIYKSPAVKIYNILLKFKLT